jgi:hypothetical protein
MTYERCRARKANGWPLWREPGLEGTSTNSGAAAEVGALWRGSQVHSGANQGRVGPSFLQASHKAGGMW